MSRTPLHYKELKTNLRSTKSISPVSTSFIDVIQQNREISCAVPYASTPTEQSEEISHFSWSKTEKTNNMDE